MAEQAEKANAGPVAVDYIRHAMEDEAKHYTLLQQLYRELTGRSYEAEPKRITFASLSEGLLAAMNDEYEAMEEYRTVYLANKNDRIRNVFLELMTDELEHATRFNYVLQLLQADQT